MHGSINTFLYACKSEEKSKDKYLSRVFPLIMSKVSDMFSLPDCTFGLSWFQEKTARALVWYSQETVNVFTLETSAFGYFDKSKQHVVINFTPFNLAKIGRQLVKSVYIYESKDHSEFDLDAGHSIIEMIESNSDKFHEVDRNGQENGSDSEPSGDEYTTKEKINKFLSGSIASKIGVLGSAGARYNSSAAQQQYGSYIRVKEANFRRAKKKQQVKVKQDCFLKYFSQPSWPSPDDEESTKNKLRDASLTPSRTSQSYKSKPFSTQYAAQKRQVLRTCKNNLIVDPIDLFSYKKSTVNVICSYQNKLYLSEKGTRAQPDFFLLNQESNQPPRAPASPCATHAHPNLA